MKTCQIDKIVTSLIACSLYYKNSEKQNGKLLRGQTDFINVYATRLLNGINNLEAGRLLSPVPYARADMTPLARAKWQKTNRARSKYKAFL